MILIKCDLCNRKCNRIDSLILYSKTIDYCDKCSEKIEKIQDELKKEMKFQEVLYDSALRKKERKLIKEYTK